MTPYYVEALKKPWLLWDNDPCPEGGWNVTGFDTQEEAVEAARKRHELEEKRHQEMVEYREQRGGEKWKRSSNCYDGCVVTPGIVFKLEVEADRDPPEKG